MGKTYYLEDGLLKFESLRNDKLQILTTYDNNLWGNMNPYFSKSEEEKKRIEENDNKIANNLKTKLSFVLTTPTENTVCNLNNRTYQYLKELNKKQETIDSNMFVSLRANSLILSKKNEKTSIIIAPADCPVLVVTDKKRTFVIVIHLGLPQYIQNLHTDTIKFAGNYFDLNQELDVFVTPYICSEHYLIAKDKYEKILNNVGESFKGYTNEIYSDIWKENRYSINIKQIIKDELKHLLPKANIIDTGMCTYEEVEKGNLFSHKFVTDHKQLGNEINEGNFNVLINI